jgi:hypothetical protein
VIPPVFQISRLEQVPDQPEKALIKDVLAENRHQHLMIEVVETAADIPFDEPRCSPPVVVDLSQCSVTATIRPESM